MSTTTGTTLTETVDLWLGKIPASGNVVVSVVRELKAALDPIVQGTDAQTIVQDVLGGIESRGMYESGQLRDMLLDLRLSAS